MLKHARHRLPSHSTVVAYVALFLAVGGASIAAAGLGERASNGRENVTVRKKSVTLSGGSCQNFGSSRSCSYGPTPVTARCRRSEHATGGGYEGLSEGVANINGPRRLSSPGTYSKPSPGKGTPKGWTVDATGSTFGPTSGSVDAPTFTVYAVCST